MMTDSRSRYPAYSRPYLRKSSDSTATSADLAPGGSAVRIFQHQRDPAHADPQKRSLSKSHAPETFDAALKWFDGLLNAERRAAANQRSPEPPSASLSSSSSASSSPPASPRLGRERKGSGSSSITANTTAAAVARSSVSMIFIDEKRCAKTLQEETPTEKLQARLRIDDWNPTHYMSAFCRFPAPLDLDDSDDEVDDVDDVSSLWDYRYSIGHPFDWDMIWIYLPATRTSLGVVRTWFDGYDANFLSMEDAVASFPGSSLAHPMLLGLVALQILTGDTLVHVRDKGNRLYEAQKQTGFHSYSRLRETFVDHEDGATEKVVTNLASITEKILGASSHLTGWENTATQLGRFAKFVGDETRKINGVSSPSSQRRLDRYMIHQTEKLAGDLDGAFHDAQAWLETAQFLLQGVLNLVSSHDSNVNIGLARDSKKIAEEAKRDSTSMTAIAVVTMFFLPATFTASFFDLAFIETSIAEMGMSGLDFYWVVTVPLTIGVLLCWVVWTRCINPPVRRKASPLDARRPGPMFAFNIRR